MNRRRFICFPPENGHTVHRLRHQAIPKDNETGTLISPISSSFFRQPFPVSKADIIRWAILPQLEAGLFVSTLTIPFNVMSFRGLYSLCNRIKDGYTVRRADVGSIIERDANIPASKRRQTAGRHETESGGSRQNHVSSDPMEWSAEGGQRLSSSLRTRRLNLGSRALRRLFGESAEVQQDNNPQEVLPRSQSQVSIHSSASSIDLGISAEGRASIRARTEIDRRRDPFVASLNDEPRGSPPPYVHGLALPSYEIVIEEEWRRIRSLRRRTLDHASNTATSWRRPFDRQQRERRRREWSRLEAHERSVEDESLRGA